jgi:hypothetical protein
MFPFRLLLVTLLMHLLTSCEHKNINEPVFKCDSSVLLEYNDIKPIVTSKCSYNGCHNGSNNSVPTFLTEQDLKDNIADCKMQLERGAMPPAGSDSITDFDKAKLLCWINNHTN